MEIGIRGAKANLSKLVQSALAGEKVIIMKHGRPLAEIVPPRPESARPDRGYGSLKNVLRLPKGWDSLAADEEVLHQFDFYREEQAAKSKK
ncbi:MAG TPA: type II toxin-antitoxin system prevent-host-death family antitoxin [Bryobacteraceae bacterium]|jgi:prevent-host-death family protein